MKAIDLNKYKDIYKLELDEAHKLEPKGKADPWYLRVPCKYGHIYPHSSSLLAFFCNSTNISNKIKESFPDIKITQDGDGETIFVFKEDKLSPLSDYMKPKNKKKISSKTRDRLLAQIGQTC